MIIDWNECNNCDTTEDKLNFVVDRYNGLAKKVYENTSFYAKDFYTSAEVRQILGISKKTLENYCSNGSIRFSKPNGIRYFFKEDIIEYAKGKVYKKYKSLTL